MKSDIHHELKEIRRALEHHRQAGPQQARAADRLQREIDDFLQATPEPDKDEQENMLKPLKESIEQFEVAHPTLGLMIEKFLDTLSNLGI